MRIVIRNTQSDLHGKGNRIKLLRKKIIRIGASWIVGCDEGRLYIKGGGDGSVKYLWNITFKYILVEKIVPVILTILMEKFVYTLDPLGLMNFTLDQGSHNTKTAWAALI